MTAVNPSADDDLHAPMLMGLLFRQVSATFAAENWRGLRQSHFRVMSCVPREGISITDLADRVGMTKQGCGQFVTSLSESGHLVVETDPADRRTRVVKRTALGRRVVKQVIARNLRIEQEWAQRVGSKRYAEFRHVLEELALG